MGINKFRIPALDTVSQDFSTLLIVAGGEYLQLKKLGGWNSNRVALPQSTNSKTIKNLYKVRKQLLFIRLWRSSSVNDI